MKPSSRPTPETLAKSFDKDVDTLDGRLKEFLKSGDPLGTQAMRKATRRLRTSHSVLPRKVRKQDRIRRYVSASRKLSKVTGRLRDIDTIVAWSLLIPEGSDRRSLTSDLGRLRASSLRKARQNAKDLSERRTPSIGPEELDPDAVAKRFEKIEGRLAKRVDDDFEEFLSTQEIEAMHSLRRHARQLRHLLELVRKQDSSPLLIRLRSIQDELGAIRDHDLVIDYLRSRVRLTSTRGLVREEIARRHAKLEDFITRYRGRGRVVTV